VPVPTPFAGGVVGAPKLPSGGHGTVAPFGADVAGLGGCVGIVDGVRVVLLLSGFELPAVPAIVDGVVLDPGEVFAFGVVVVPVVPVVVLPLVAVPPAAVPVVAVEPGVLAVPLAVPADVRPVVDVVPVAAVVPGPAVVPAVPGVVDRPVVAVVPGAVDPPAPVTGTHGVGVVIVVGDVRCVPDAGVVAVPVDGVVLG
jgi:hypothetical protein